VSRHEAGVPHRIRARGRWRCLIYFERVESEGLPDVEGKIDMAARQQVANKLRTPYWRASKADKGKILDRVIATTGMGRSTARRMLTGPGLADQAERVR
jgi:hypothetical protein